MAAAEQICMHQNAIYKIHLSNKSKLTQIANYTVFNLPRDFSAKNIEIVRVVPLALQIQPA